MFGTLVAGSAAFFVVAVAVFEMADALVDRRRLNSEQPRSKLPGTILINSPSVTTLQTQVPEPLRKAA
ncbi:MAG TPA: hypothetical protein VLI06_08875 [Solimonas sp.]|nr:hypothetical protein [Solimonas sp.]